MSALLGGARICAIADGRSPIARNWLSHLTASGREVHLISTFPCESTGLGVASVNVVPIVFARFAGGARAAATASPAERGKLGARVRARVVPAVFPTVFGRLGPVEVRRHVARVRALLDAIAPDVVHAMRIPFEGIVAAEALEGTALPLVVSIWGNDLELWAARYRGVARLTRRVLRRATALHADCRRDLDLATAAYGWDASRPGAVLPSNGGIRSSLFQRAPADADVLARLGIPRDRPIVLNARGFRTYVRNDTFFASIPRVLAHHPDAVFVAGGMADDARALAPLAALGVEAAVRLLPVVSPADMAQLFRAAEIAVSPSVFDGTPNTLLEAMACGAFPVVGDIASVREWVVDGENGLLHDPASPDDMARAIVRALDDDGLRARAAAHNSAEIAERADIDRVMLRVEALYAAAIIAASAAGPSAGARGVT